MSSFELQKCEPGWGYDCITGLFIPINYDGNLRTEIDEKEIYCFYKENPFHPSPFLYYDDLAHWVINDNPNYPKFMEFYFANYQISEFGIKVQCWTKHIEAEKSDDYPPEATHFVQRVYYGLEMFMFFDKENSLLFPADVRVEFLNKVWKGEGKLTKDQENAECSVLIFAKNPEETTIKRMKMSEVVKFFVDFKNEKYPEYETITSCRVSEITEGFSVDDYALFNENYKTKQKLEMFFSKLWHPGSSSD